MNTARVVRAAWGVKRCGLSLLLGVVLLSSGGCAGRLDRAVDRYYAGEPQQALDVLETSESRRDRLLYLLERGVIHHDMGNYRQSTQHLRGAVRLIAELETLSVSEQAGALLTNDWLRRYAGEYSERLWVHTYLMMNALLQGRLEEAQVEARQALEKLQEHPEALAGDYFTRALIALCFAGVGEDNDAYLVYRRLAEDLPAAHPVAADLVRLAARLGMPDEVIRYRAELPEDLPQGAAELVLFIANGRVARKQPGNVVLPPTIRFAFPYYRGTGVPLPRIRIRSDERALLPPLSTNLNVVAADALQARMNLLLARETARVGAKEALAQSVGHQQDAGAELAVRLVLFLLEEPDTRSWRTLPARLTLVRIPLPAGEHHLHLELVTPASAGPGRVIELPAITLRAGQRSFHALRF